MRMTSVTSIPCPCGSGLELARCCAPYLRGERLPPDAQALMRSRYSAYVLGDEAYLLDTWHPRTRPAELDLDRDGRVRWLGLKVRKHEVLDANRLESGVLQLAEQDCDLAEIIEIVTRARHDAAGERGVTIIARVAEGLLCRGDSNRLRQALSCVVDNAIKFSPTDGIININMLRGPKGQLVMSVTDAGKGISAEDMGRLFNPFRQLDEGAARHHGGLGLGLFIARGILRLHGGDVTLTSSPEKGTEVWLVLPAGRINWKTLQPPHDEATTAKRVA